MQRLPFLRCSHQENLASAHRVVVGKGLKKFSNKYKETNVKCKYLIIHSPRGLSGIIYNTGWGTLQDCLRCSLQVMKE